MDVAVDTDPTLTLDRIREDVAEALGCPPSLVGDDDDLLMLGLDSIALMRLASRWHSQGVPVTFSELIEWRTLAQWWRLVEERDAEARPAQLPPVVVDESAPFGLATMQHAYWVGRADGQPLGGVGAHFYNEFDGAGVDPDRLDAAVRTVLRRHGMLRAEFHTDGTQRIRPESPWPGLTVHDLRELPPHRCEEELARLRHRLSHRRLRVEESETFDIQLSLLPGGATRVHVHVEMLVADAHSFRLILSDLAAFYRDPDRQVAPVSLSYPAYLATVAARPDEARDRAREYWRERLDTLPGPPQLPTAVDPATVEGHRVVRRYHWLTPQQQAELERRAAAAGVTLSMVFLAAFAEVLAAWSSSGRFVLNLPMYDRRPVHPDVGAVVGDFTNLVLLEIDTTGPAGFVDLVRRHQDRLRSDAAHSTYSGIDVLRDLSRARTGQPVGAPVVFTSALSLGELFDAEVRDCFGLPGWTMSQTPQVWLDYQITEREDGLYLNWDVVDELFPEGFVDDMFAAYLGIVDWLLDPATDWSGRAPIALPAHTLAARASANDTAGPIADGPLHRDVFAWAAREPDRPAVLAGPGRAGVLTYGELAGRAQALADELTARGLAPGDAVAVTLPKGPDQIVAVLGVLRAGGVYVPIGVDQPNARRELIRATAAARFTVTTAGAADGSPVDSSTTLTVPTVGVPLRDDAPPVDPEQDAYLLFTSGSTGAPKGVRVPHRAARNTLDDLVRRFAIGPDDRVLAVSALDFDLSVFDMFALLGVGGAVVTVTEDTRRDPAAWLRLVHEHRVTVWQSVPALLDLLLTQAETGAAEDAGPLPLRLAVLGGDRVGLDLAGRLAEVAPGSRLYGLGGTTETAIHSTVQSAPVDPPPHWRSVPYGVPLRNQLMRVVDEHGRDRPDWVPGELWIGGRSVAAGYAGDPRRTADRFVEHAGQRWYRTGDLARYWPDGTVDFLGRTDFQVKIRGHRIELGEIEAALERDPDVSRALAQVVEGATLAVAVTVTRADADPQVIRQRAAEQLPPYMVPAVVVVLDAFPLSANGKIDRARLPELVAARPAVAGTAPRGAVETAVAALWSELLDVPEVHREDNFFALGGDSLVATRLLARLRETGIAGAELHHLFHARDLAGFAVRLRTTGTAGAPAERRALTADPAHRHDPFPPTDVQRAYWMGRTADFALGGVGSHWYWEFDGGDVDLDRLRRAVDTLIARHEMLRAVFDDNGDQRILPEVPPFTITVHEGQERLATLREQLSHRVPDPSRWPLIDIQAVRHPGGTRVAFSFDYIVLDALSIVVFFSELSTLYRDPDAELRPLGVSFRDYVLGAAAPPEAVERAGAYWRGRLDDIAPAPALPLAVDPETLVAPRFVRRERSLTPQQWAAINRRARDHRLTPAAVLATAYAEVLSAYSGQDELTLNLTMFQRHDVHPDIGAILGDFTSLILVGYRGAAGQPWRETTHRFQQDLWAGLEHNDVSALWVLRELARRRNSGTVSMPIVFTSALGVAADLVNMRFPFGELTWGISQTPQVWLDNQVMERDGGLTFNWDSVDELFPDGLLDAMFDAYHRLLCWLADGDWDRPLPDMLPPGQRAVRAAVNATDAPAPGHTLHGPFFSHAARDPDRLAVAYGETSISYGELATRALRIAGALLRAGVEPGDAVAVTVPRGPEQVAAVLGVLAAGASYVPVSVDQPAARRDRIHAKAQVTAVVGRHDGHHLPTVAADVDGPPLRGPVTVDADALAYTIFTSGSTGEPKGVEITHRAAVNTVTDINSRYGVGPQDRVLAVSALDFDLSVYDVFGLLAAGGALVVLADEDRREARRWAWLAHRWGVTVWNSVPALLDMLLVAAGDHPPSGLRLALVSGDWIGLDLPDRLARVAPHARFVALGGATEAAIWSNACEVAVVPEHWRSIPYGRPLRNQRYRVTDSRDRDCPDWVPGELRIGGTGVALGYRNAPELTARQFGVDDEGRRWYRTGDLGRYWPDGTLEFLGRVDFQVKVRGHRIELGEIEAAAEAHPLVGRAVAMVVGQAPTQHIGLAVVPATGGTEPDLAGWLAERLPAYMVPEYVVTVEQLPLTANGKVDRQRLGTLLRADPLDDTAEPPKGPTEELLAALWSQLLDQPVVDRRHSFFALGGDSMLATRLLEALRQRLGVDMTLRQLFAVPVLAQLAAAVDEQLRASAHDDVEEGVI
ncbi:amino acid adenylation domain-containing protein [Micromonospora sp. NPDC047527]|uniref:amino acid adenylation domain-containing protein n=1 Tax=Micromonospora sp. NPDC047527 TaxID=3155144 RepID=UPI0033F88B93